MPLYEYECTTHGVFELQRSVSESAAPGPCPECGGDASRILSVPRLAAVGAAERIGRDRNERSRHEPRVATRAAATERPELRSAAGGLPWAIGHG